MHSLRAVKRLTAIWSIRSAMMTIVTLGTVAGCTVSLIGAYDDTIDKGITEFQQKAEIYFVKLQSDANTPYDPTVYQDLDVRLGLLKTRAAALPKYSIISDQVANLQKQVDDFQKIDSAAKRPLASVITTAPRSAVSVSVESILKLELALKRGESP